MSEALDLGQPAWFLDQLDLQTGAARFVRADRERLSREPFLDPRWDRSGLPTAELRGAALDADAEPRPRLNFIWHTSFCCSTVIATALDSAGLNLSLKEPRAVVDLADLKRRQQGLKRPGLARAVFGLFARRFTPAEQILIKPSNFANNVIPEATEMTDGRMIMLYSSCRSFLISMVKTRQERRRYARELFIALANDGHPQTRWPIDTLLRLSDLEIAALTWRMQMSTLRTAMGRLGSRAASLDGDVFLERPREALSALDAFLGLGLGPARIEAVVEGPLLSRDAKTGAAAAGRHRRRADAEAVEAQFGDDLDRVVDWAAEASGEADHGLPQGLI